MNDIFGLSIGCVNRLFDKDRNEYVSFIRKHFEKDINALEIIIPSSQFHTFHLSHENRVWVDSLEYLSFHIPKMETEIEWKGCGELLTYFYKVKNIVCHIDSKKHINNEFMVMFGEKIIYENTEDIFYPILDEENICLDICHLIYKHDFEDISKINLDRIKEIHLSNIIKDGNSVVERHRPFFNSKKNFKKLQTYIDLKNYPVIVEENFSSLSEMRQEINFLKESI